MPARRLFVTTAVCLLLLLAVPASILLPTHVYAVDASAEWRIWAEVAWRYFQPDVAWNQKTGLHHDAYGWRQFTDWGLASHIFSVVAAQQLGLMVGTPYTLEYRATKILDFLSNRSLSSGVPYLVYSTDDGRPAATAITNAADYGRLLIALYLLKQCLLQNSYTGLASRVDYIVNNYTKPALQLRSQLGNDFYSFYVGQGFKLWGVDISKVEQDFQNLRNGPSANPSDMYGVEGIPSSVRVTPEVIMAGLLELDDVSAVTSSPAWALFGEFGSRVYKTQEARHASTGRLTAWTEGGVDSEPGYVYEWVVDPTGRAWTILDPNLHVMWSQNDGPNQSYGKPVVSKLPVVFTKIAFALHALYGTDYTRTLVDALYSQTSDSLGFREGVWEGGGVDGNRQVQTSDLILSAAAYAIRHQPSATETTSQTTTSSGALAQASSTQTTGSGMTSGKTIVVISPTMQIGELPGLGIAVLAALVLVFVILRLRGTRHPAGSSNRQ